MLSPSNPPPLFPATRWTLLQRVRSGTQAEALAALEVLCRSYWRPLYCVARHRAISEADAQDAVQGFFESLLRRETFATADEAMGKLRQLLLCAFDNFCTQQWHKAHRQKRGDGAVHLELAEFTVAEEHYRKTALETANIEQIYNRQWASALLERGLDALRADYERRGWLSRYQLLVGPLLRHDAGTPLGQLASEAGMSAGALRVTLHRMRMHYRDKIERELAATLDTEDPALIREEMAELFRAFA